MKKRYIIRTVFIVLGRNLDRAVRRKNELFGRRSLLRARRESRRALRERQSFVSPRFGGADYRFFNGARRNLFRADHSFDLFLRLLLFGRKSFDFDRPHREFFAAGV